MSIIINHSDNLNLLGDILASIWVFQSDVGEDLILEEISKGFLGVFWDRIVDWGSVSYRLFSCHYSKFKMKDLILLFMK